MNKKTMKTIGEYVGQKELDRIRRVNDYFRLKDITELLNLTKEDLAGFTFIDKVIKYEKELYVSERVFMQILITYAGSKNRLYDNYYSNVAVREISNRNYGAYIDSEVYEDDLDAINFARKFNNSNFDYSKEEKLIDIFDPDLDDKLCNITEDDLDVIYREIFDEI